MVDMMLSERDEDLLAGLRKLHGEIGRALALVGTSGPCRCAPGPAAASRRDHEPDSDEECDGPPVAVELARPKVIRRRRASFGPVG